MTKQTTPEPGWLPLLARVLEGLPALRDAACAGRAELFDPPADGETVDSARNRHEVAAAICRRCPDLARCREWAATQRPSRGVLAGRVPALNGPGRPPTTAARTTAPHVGDRELVG